jgi:pantoate--beta-alanine ligase
MKILHTVDETRAACRLGKRDGALLGFVPTMGALHEGHLSLVRAARSQAGFVVASIFVNPLQFGPQEDFNRYPRTLERDSRLLESEGVDLLFAPATEEMYPATAGPQSSVASRRPEKQEEIDAPLDYRQPTFVEVPGLSEKLEGRIRPGHFRGVTTVVSKLFHILEPDIAFFGQKDAQQAVIIQRMVDDLNLPTRIVVCPTVREADGLALSSRNVYLNPQQRQAATVLYRALMRVRALAKAGERSAADLSAAGREIITAEPMARLDYFEVIHPQTLDPIGEILDGALVVTAAYFGKTRLIDNLVLHVN